MRCYTSCFANRIQDIQKIKCLELKTKETNFWNYLAIFFNENKIPKEKLTTNYISTQQLLQKNWRSVKHNQVSHLIYWESRKPDCYHNQFPATPLQYNFPISINEMFNLLMMAILLMFFIPPPKLSSINSRQSILPKTSFLLPPMLLSHPLVRPSIQHKNMTLALS